MREKTDNLTIEKKYNKCFGKKSSHRIIYIILVGVMILFGIKYYIKYNQENFEVNFYNISSSKLSEKLRIVYLTDLHEREYGIGNKKLLKNIENLNPDLILCGGDFITYGDNDYAHVLEFYRKISEIAPVYAVMGNHEDAMVFIDNITDLPNEISETGVELLRNQTKEITIGSNKIEITGLCGGEEQFELYGGRTHMDNLSCNSDCFRICICHVPIVFPNCLSEYEFDLGLAGHTHGGIIRLPILGPLYSCEEGLFPKFADGMKDINGKPLIISRGLGDSHKIPRINNMPELVVIDMNCD